MPGIEVSKLADGRTLIVPSQSWLGTAFNCMEQARLEMVGGLPRVETDATAIGTAMHAGIEAVLRGEDFDGGLSVAVEKMEELAQQENFKWVQVKTLPTAVDTVTRVFIAWVNNIYPQLPDMLAVEHPFDVSLHEDDDLVIRLKGTMDFLGTGEDGKPCVWDWKTANRPYDAWEKERWAIQPTVYCHALAQEYGDDEYEFTFAVSIKRDGSSQVITVKRNAGHSEWLRRQVLSLAHVIKADLPIWPLRDQHALCSDKWCPVYQSCKGSHV